MISHQEALQDLATSMGWDLFEQHAVAELNDRQAQLMAKAATTDPTTLGYLLREHQAIVATVRALLLWPKRRAQELAEREAVASRRVS